MRRILLLFMILPAFCRTQDYKTIQPDLEVYFEPTEGIFLPLDFIGIVSSNLETQLLRSCKFAEDSTGSSAVYYSNHTELQSVEYSLFHQFEDCILQTQPSWIGDPVIVRNDGYNVFYNRQNDSILINTLAEFGETFTFYSYPDGSFFLATISAVEPITFLGITDIAKTISLQYYSYSSQPASHPLNDFEIIITENHGFYKVLNFRDFPGFGEETYQVREHILYGHENIDPGYKKMTFRDIYDFEINDEYHYTWDYYFDPFGWNQNLINIVLDKEWLSGNTVKYKFRQEKWGYEGPIPFYEMYHTIDTIYEIHSNLDSVISDHLPFEPFVSNENSEELSFVIVKTDDYNGHPSLGKTNNGYISYSNDSCFHRWWFDSGSLYSTEFVMGCGVLENYYSYDYPTVSFYYNDVAYFNKGGEEWGVPLNPPVGVRENESKKYLILFPNPAINEIKIIKSNDLVIKNITIFSTSGQPVIIKNRFAKSIDLSFLVPGLYFVDVLTDQGIIRKKLVLK